MGKLNCNTMFLSVLEIVHSLWHWWHSFHLQFCIYIVVYVYSSLSSHQCICLKNCIFNLIYIFLSNDYFKFCVLCTLVFFIKNHILSFTDIKWQFICFKTSHLKFISLYLGYCIAYLGYCVSNKWLYHQQIIWIYWQLMYLASRLCKVWIVKVLIQTLVARHSLYCVLLTLYLYNLHTYFCRWDPGLFLLIIP